MQHQLEDDLHSIRYPYADGTPDGLDPETEAQLGLEFALEAVDQALQRSLKSAQESVQNGIEKSIEETQRRLQGSLKFAQVSLQLYLLKDGEELRKELQ